VTDMISDDMGPYSCEGILLGDILSRRVRDIFNPTSYAGMYATKALLAPINIDVSIVLVLLR